jgi:DNA-binding NtrC family response regulator
VIESELFGHERGAFTGAGERRVGRLERAGTGTLFLDEIADVEPRLQAKLLRVLQDRAFERVGGGQTLPFRARIVAATNRDLAREIEGGRFRADLYYRLQVVELHVPPLRARLSDLPLLVRDLAARQARDPEIREAFLARLRAHDWPGNVRELANLVERLCVARPEGPWHAELLDELGQPLRGRARPAELADARTPRQRFDEQERAALEELLAAHRFNVSAAARSLGISRGALRGRMRRLGL